MKTKVKILEAAASLFGRNGYTGTTTAAIAREAGVAEVTLFRHFGGKEKLFAEALEHIQNRGSITTLSDSLNGRLEDDLRMIAEKLGAYFFREQATIRMMLFESMANPTIQENLLRGPMKSIAFLEAYFHAHVPEGSLSPQTLAQIFIGGLFGMVISQSSISEEDSLRRVDVYTRHFIAGLAD